MLDGLDLNKEIPAWALNDAATTIKRTFEFVDFKRAFEFMSLCAQYAEEMKHHPDWSNSWNKVVVELTTHSVGGLTKQDIELAKAMDAFAEQVAITN